MSEARRLHGTPASPGAAVGPVFVYRPRSERFPRTPHPTSADQIDSEIERFSRAVEETRLEIEEQLDAVEGEPAAILGTHLLMLADPLLVDATVDRIRSERLPAEDVLSSVISELSDSLRQLDDDYLRNRASDVEDVGQRLRRRLRGETQASLELSGAIVVARDLTPSEVLTFAQAGAAALALEEGAVSSHAAILARSLRVPVVVGVRDLLLTVAEGATLLVDGDTGEIAVAGAQAAARARSEQRRHLARPFPETRTADGRRIQLYANLGRPEELDFALEAGAEGIGVLRTEFLFLEKSPSEEHQYRTYRHLVERLQGRPLVVRTLDVGGDKPLPYLPLAPEPNPFLGLRGLRLSLAQPDLFRTQLRAILRAGAHGRLQLMYPMVTDVSELRQAKAILAQVRNELHTEGLSMGEEVEAGAMIEVPAAAICADQLAAEAAFLSVGTNDLAQYTLAADRNSPTVVGIYSQTHLAVLRLLRSTVEGARRWRRPVAVCGEVASDTEALPLLIGMGVDELSVAPSALQEVRAALEAMSYAEAVERVRDL